MRAISLCLLIGFTCVSGVLAQDRSFGTLPLAQKPGASALGGPKIEDTEAYQQALRVYNKLVAARGDFRYPVPTFAMRREERSVAYMNYNKMEITLEEKAYDVCKSYGNDADAAIAFLLGHELTHYYEKHAWRRGFAAEYKDLPIGMKLDSLFDDVAHETEADYLGGFLAYSAGFGLFDKGADVIQKLYTAYQLPDKLSGYPSLADRQTIGKRTAEKLKQLVDVFEMANLLTATGNYTEAYEYYRYVLMQYQSREIYNNLGVTTVLEVLKKYTDEKDLKFRFPLQLDLESTLERGSGMADARTKLLRQALLHFDAAISLDPNYAPAFLNKACVYVLLGDSVRARFYAEQEALLAAQRGNYPKAAVDVDILLGIMEAKAGNTKKAQLLFQKAVSSGSALAAYNLKALKNEPVGDEKVGLTGLPKTEKIDGLSMSDIEEDLRVDPNMSINLSKDLTFHQNPEQGPGSKLFVSQNARTEVNTLFDITNPGYPGQTARGIGVGADRKAITDAYGEPKRTLETPRGQIMVYSAILFILGPDNKLERWAMYY